MPSSIVVLARAALRVFGLAHWKGKIPAGIVSNATVSSLDFLPTILALAGVPLPSDRSFDGVDLAPLLFDGAPSVRDFLFMGDTTDRVGNITAIHYKNFKAYRCGVVRPRSAGTCALCLRLPAPRWRQGQGPKQQPRMMKPFLN
jgi:hypothetical protein